MTYPYHDLRDYLSDLERRGLLQRIERAINKDRELVPLVRLQFRGLPAEERKGFLFENVVDSLGRRFEGSVAIGTFASSKEVYRLAVGGGACDIDSGWARGLANPVLPTTVNDGPCKEIILKGRDLDARGGIDAFPHPISTPGFDPAPFVTAGCWVSRDVDDGSYNVGTYRGMVKGPRRLGLQMDTPSQHIAVHLAKARRAGKKLEVAIVIGCVPAVGLASVQKLPYGVSEYELAGGLMGRPLELIMAETVDLAVPSHAEVVIEGTIDPTMLEPEGPFGEASGYMGPRTWSPVLEVSCVTHRARPIVQSFISEFPPSESTLMRKFGFESVYRRFLRDQCNNGSVAKVAFFESASSNMVIVIQLDHPSAGQAWQALYAVAGYDPSLGKVVIAVDSDVDPSDLEGLMWALSYRLRPAQDVAVLQGRVPRLDPSFPARAGGVPVADSSSLLIDATRGSPYPPTSLPARSYVESALQLWNELGLPTLALRQPWWGAEFGLWTDENRSEAAIATEGRYLETGKKLAALRRQVEL